MVRSSAEKRDEVVTYVAAGQEGAEGPTELPLAPWIGAHGVPPSWDPPAWPGPRLRIVHGPDIGRCFHLRGRPNDPDRGWVMGSGDEVDIDLHRDAYVDGQAVDLDRSEGGFELVSLRTADERVSLNGRELERGDRRQLEDKDLVGLGSSLLVFRS